MFWVIRYISTHMKHHFSWFHGSTVVDVRSQVTWDITFQMDHEKKHPSPIIHEATRSATLSDSTTSLAEERRAIEQAIKKMQFSFSIHTFLSFWLR
jgi:hypothetical protein